ncbi:hypothetical protein M0F12_24395 [Ralstonia solanacearum]|uniref:hypothetical protein n=1 Tax=Ralstonia solanacearum TaxID=305 RepID=UPI0004478686|nr:hypothetical protein [Ralstonia solanacearum]EUJ11810.1 hypothetical protein RSP673_24255 [Ralstonia solanacearum P673]MCL9852198.1 hypothetical protein [Ralstonia solanacearum]MCL9857042.1 hypothetical protein [Ralstonia solanacearum]MCL9861853.1 hypothetical protein [Ralstonia solanacearum]MCL9866643.1 hypothetical protein [Ralstonia solanacearum]
MAIEKLYKNERTAVVSEDVGTATPIYHVYHPVTGNYVDSFASLDAAVAFIEGLWLEYWAEQPSVAAVADECGDERDEEPDTEDTRPRFRM